MWFGSVEGWCTGIEGWRVGCNPPFVLCGIRLIGLPALPVETSSAPVCPFHLQDGRFTASHPASSTLQRASSSLAGRTFRFCSVAKALTLRPCGRCNSTRGRSFLKPIISRLESHTPTRQPTHNAQQYAIRILENLYFPNAQVTCRRVTQCPNASSS